MISTRYGIFFLSTILVAACGGSPAPSSSTQQPATPVLPPGARRDPSCPGSSSGGVDDPDPFGIELAGLRDQLVGGDSRPAVLRAPRAALRPVRRPGLRPVPPRDRRPVRPRAPRAGLPPVPTTAVPIPARSPGRPPVWRASPRDRHHLRRHHRRHLLRHAEDLSVTGLTLPATDFTGGKDDCGALTATDAVTELRGDRHRRRHRNHRRWQGHRQLDGEVEHDPGLINASGTFTATK